MHQRLTRQSATAVGQEELAALATDGAFALGVADHLFGVVREPAQMLHQMVGATFAVGFRFVLVLE
jgi:hypothetical protein